MIALLLFIGYFLIALISGAAISYPVYEFLSNWMELDFERVANRCVLIAAILFFVALCKKINFSAGCDLGYSTDKRQFYTDIVKGIGLGVLIMSTIAVGLLITNNRIIDTIWGLSALNIISILASGLISGLMIALLEETLFRGAMLSAIRRESTAFIAITVTSFFYALVHFIQPEIQLDSNSLDWTSGFVLLKYALANLANVSQIADSLIALFLAGVLLSIVRLRTNRIAICIGIHAGWVLVIQVTKRITDSNSDSEFAFLTGSYDNVTGYLAAVFLIFIIVLYLNRTIQEPASNHKQCTRERHTQEKAHPGKSSSGHWPSPG
ncbi:CPBP family intramembrane metalloprotease [bacterium]|nr:CPBP family intramembrane metalloprotease [bacterium]